MWRHRFEKRASKAVVFGWQHGRYADCWSLTHFLSGCILGTLAALLEIPIFYALSGIAAILVAYEFFELGTDVVEDVSNSITDVVLGFFSASILFLIHLPLRPSLLFLAACIGANAILLQLGWTHYLKKKAALGASFGRVRMVFRTITWTYAGTAITLTGLVFGNWIS
jgi:hypothetical protein